MVDAAHTQARNARAVWQPRFTYRRLRRAGHRADRTDRTRAGPGRGWGGGGGGHKHRQTDRHTHQYHDSAEGPGRVKFWNGIAPALARYLCHSAGAGAGEREGGEAGALNCLQICTYSTNTFVTDSLIH